MARFKSRARLAVAVLLLAAVTLTLYSCSAVEVARQYERAAVATAEPIATEVALRIFDEGGNAFDAAVAVGFTLAVVHPRAGNIGGGGFAVMHDASTREVAALDFRETAPLAASDSMYLDANGEVIPDMSLVGAAAAGVPGTVAGMYQLWRRNGSLSWPDLIGPAATLADTGFIVSDSLAAEFAAFRNELSQFDETAAAFLPGGSPLRAGDRFIQKDLAATLYRIAAEELAGFYEGQTAERIIQTMETYGGLITHEDLQRYTPIWRDPIHVRFDSLDVYSMPPPSSGGMVIAQILDLIEPIETGRLTPGTADYLHLFTEVERVAFADRTEHLGDPDFYEIPDRLLSPEYLDQRRELIDREHATSSQHIRPGQPTARESDQTTHYSVADSMGNVVAVTYTLNSSYGSRLVVDGAGFILNNEMDDFSIKPGAPNQFGLVGSAANKIEPGKRMLSSMSPTIVLKDGEPILALGARGGPRIISYVANILVAMSRFGLSMRDAVKTGRSHHQYIPDILYLEQDAFDITVKQGLLKYGHMVEERTMFGDVQAIFIDDNGLIEPYSDSRNRGAADGR